MSLHWSKICSSVSNLTTAFGVCHMEPMGGNKYRAPLRLQSGGCSELATSRFKGAFLLSPLLFIFVLACSTSTPTNTPASALTPTVEPSIAVNTPTTEALRAVILPTSIPNHRPTPQTTPVLTLIPTQTPQPTPTPVLPPLPVKITDGIDTLIICAGNTREYWLTHGPPKLTAELVECLRDKLGKEGN